MPAARLLLLLPLLALPADPIKTSFAVLASFPWKEGAEVPKEITKLHEQTIDISGFMQREVPGSGPVDSFLLINDACGCNGTPKMNEIVFCTLEKGTTIEMKPGVVHVIGKFFVGEEKQEGVVVSLYTLDVDKVE